jgi:hypothetical protein
MAWQAGYKPDAPVLGSVTAGDQQLSIPFTQATADPAVNAYTVSYTPSGGSATTRSLTAGEISALTITLTGLSNTTSYSVTLTSTNTTFTSNASTAVSGTPNAPASTGIGATPGVGKVTVSWTAPASTDTPTGYTINWTCSASCSTASGSTTSATSPKEVTGLQSGKSYTFTVTANYSGYNGPASASASAVPQSSQLVYQDITVVRPTGALVITQRCGVYGALPQVAADSTLGFPLLTALSASTDQVGTAPEDQNGNADSQFGNYPNPDTPTYPTTCGVNMGTATLVESGSNAGNYYYATGRLNQLSIADTRDTDSGWSISGTMSTFTVTGGGTSSFSGDALGWQPIVTSDSASYNNGSGTYDQTVTAGATIDPFATSGLTSTKSLASAAAGAGLGLARVDARFKLLVPVSAPAGTYEGTLTFTII